jgi:hypothetical protein
MAHSRHPSRHSPSIPWIITSRLIGLAIFFLIVVILQHLHTGNPTLESIISFLTAPAIIALVVLFSLLFLVGEVFLALDFPLNLPGPFLNALGSTFLVSFLLRILYLVDTISHLTLFSLLQPLEPVVYLLVFFIVLIVQYVRLFSSWWKEQEAASAMASTPGETKEADSSSAPSEKEVSWGDVESEFRLMLYDFFRSVRDALRRKE